MFDKKSRDLLRKNVKAVEEERERVKNFKKGDDGETWTTEEVAEIVECHTLLGVRFGIFLLFQVQNQKSLKETIKEIAKKDLGIDVDDKNDHELIQMMMRSPNEFGERLQETLLHYFIHDESVNHAQGIVAGHAKQNIEELVSACRGFSEQVDEYYEEHQDEAPLSASIN
jgi:methyl-accepting chemotaxis protein